MRHMSERIQPRAQVVLPRSVNSISHTGGTGRQAVVDVLVAR